MELKNLLQPNSVPQNIILIFRIYLMQISNLNIAIKIKALIKISRLYDLHNSTTKEKQAALSDNTDDLQ